MIQSGGFLGRLLGPLLKSGLPVMENVIKPLAKSVLIPLRLTAAAQQQIQEYIKKLGLGNNNVGSGNNNNAILTVSNDEMKKIIEIVKSLEDSGLVFKKVSETIQNEAKEQRDVFFSMLLGTLSTIFFWKIF